MGFWEFITNATPPTAIVVSGAYVAVNKDFLTALGVMVVGAIVYFIALFSWIEFEKYRMRFG